MVGVGLTLDDLRQPSFSGHIWGYDRDEVDQLLASVVTSIERLQRRRRRDADSIDKAKAEAANANERAERAERERDRLAIRLELVREGVHDPGPGPGDNEVEATTFGRPEIEDLDAEQPGADADERAGQADQEVLLLRQELAEQRVRTRRVDAAELEVEQLRNELTLASAHAAESDVVFTRSWDLDPMLDLDPETYARLPLAQRAARALLREARARAAAIVAEADATTEGEKRASVSS